MPGPARAGAAKSGNAFLTISEASEIIGVPQHVLRFWETRFPQLQPLKRGGNRRYYRPEDMALLQTIRTMLHDQGLTIRGAQQALAARPKASVPGPDRPQAQPRPAEPAAPAIDIAALRGIRDRLAAALS